MTQISEAGFTKEKLKKANFKLGQKIKIKQKGEIDFAFFTIGNSNSEIFKNDNLCFQFDNQEKSSIEIKIDEIKELAFTEIDKVFDFENQNHKFDSFEEKELLLSNGEIKRIFFIVLQRLNNFPNDIPIIIYKNELNAEKQEELSFSEILYLN